MFVRISLRMLRTVVDHLISLKYMAVMAPSFAGLLLYPLQYEEYSWQ